MLQDYNKDRFRAAHGWHSCWENEIYKKGRHLNRYPFDAVVSFIYKNYQNVKDRKKIKILELGFGAGNNLWFLAREGFLVAGIEGSASAVRFAKERFKKNRLIGDLQIGDFRKLPWDDKSFDVVIDRGSLTHNTYETIKATLKETRRVLKNNGKLFSALFFSNSHPERKFGKKVIKSTYDGIKKGPLKDVGRTHFASLDEIKNLYGSQLKIVSITHILEENCLTYPQTPINAYWKIECQKA
jgi:SAM-dependent methyltransferase